ncbi:MAG: hypothetical protein EON47_02725 [Acetobacteraceae bacterium]|nr:MAG: hypothetical protein EON47_02725 [Acetobacteraceae bacterium]
MSSADAFPGEIMVGQALPRRAFTLVLALLGLYVVAALAVLPFAAGPGPEINAITPVFAAVVLVTELATSFLVFVRFHEVRSWSMLLLGCACLFAALMAVLHLLTFPGAILPGRGAIGSPQSAAWSFVLWMAGYAGLSLAAVVSAAFAPQWQVPHGLAIRHGVRAAAMTVALVLGCGLAVTQHAETLPALMAGATWTPLNAAITYTALGMVTAAILLILLRVGKRYAIFLWLGLALTALLVANILSLAGAGRYSVGWSLGRLSWVLSASVLLLFFMGQFVRQQRALAQTKATLERRVAARTADLTQALRQRDLLLREVYHRVKNNLQIVDALIDSEARRIGDPAAQEAFSRMRRRIFTLGQAHQQMMISPDLRSFNIAPFLEELVTSIGRAAAPDAGVTLEVAADPVPVDLDFAIPLGLIVSELVSLAVQQDGVQSVLVAFRQDVAGGRTATLTVTGDGAQAAAETVPGNRLIAGLLRQLGGRLDASFGAVGIGIGLPIPEVP